MAGYGGETGVASPPSNTGMGYRNKRLKGAGASPTGDVINTTQKVDNTLVEVFTASSTKAKGQLPAARSMAIKNVGNSTLDVVLKVNNWTNETTIGTGAFNGANPIHTYLHMVIPRGQSLVFPTARVVSTTGEDDPDDGASLSRAITLDGDSSTLSNTAPDSNMYRTAGGAVVLHELNYTTNPIAIEVSTVGDDAFRVGDLVRVENEVMEVVGTYTNNPTSLTLADGHIGLKRGLYGTDNVAHSGTPTVNFAFFNGYHNFNAATGGYDKVQTDNDGKFKATNFFGYGRSASYTTTGILQGSVSIKCYQQGYQELGLSGITSATKTGLTAGSTYYLKVSVDGSTAKEISFTADASNTNFGGVNGVLGKIQRALDAEYYDASSHLFEKRAFVSIVDGDIRFTSGSRLSTSAIALTAGEGGADTTTEIFAQAIGRFPTAAKLQAAVAAKLPNDNISNTVTGESLSNDDVFMYDDGNGRLVGKGSGAINYDTGAIDFTSYPNAEFVISASFGSALTGALNADYKNVVEEVKVQSLNNKIKGKVSLSIGG